MNLVAQPEMLNVEGRCSGRSTFWLLDCASPWERKSMIWCLIWSYLSVSSLVEGAWCTCSLQWGKQRWVRIAGLLGRVLVKRQLSQRVNLQSILHLWSQALGSTPHATERNLLLDKRGWDEVPEHVGGPQSDWRVFSREAGRGVLVTLEGISPERLVMRNAWVAEGKLQGRCKTYWRDYTSELE